MKSIKDIIQESTKTIMLDKDKFNIVKKPDGRIHLINVKNSSDKHIFKNKKEMDEFLANYTTPKGGRQSSNF